MGPIDGNGEGGGGNTHQFYETNNVEAGASEGRREVSLSKGGGSVRSGRDPVVNDLHWKKIGDSGSVGGTEAKIRGIYKGDDI